MYRLKTFVKFLFEVFSTTKKHQKKIYLIKRSDIDELINNHMFDTVIRMLVIAKSADEAIALWPNLIHSDDDNDRELIEEYKRTLGHLTSTNDIAPTVERMYVRKEQLIVYELGVATYKYFSSPVIMTGYITE